MTTRTSIEFILSLVLLLVPYSRAQSQRAFLWTSASGMQDLGTLGGASSNAGGISLNGSYIVGSSDVDNLNYHAFLWTAADGMQDLGVLGPGYIRSAAFAVNDAGEVVGASYDIFANSRAFIWTQATGMQALPTLGGYGGEAWGINNAGQVTGWATDAAGNYRAFFWSKKTGIQSLGTLGGNVAWGSAINERGHVTGYSSVASGAYRVFLWTPKGGMQDKGIVGSFCFPFGLNDVDTSVGYCLTTGYLPFYDNAPVGMPKKLSLSGSWGGRADAINNLNQAAGYLSYPDRQHAIMWDHRKVIDLGSFGGDAEARDINDLGQVVGYSLVP